MSANVFSLQGPYILEGRIAVATLTVRTKLTIVHIIRAVAVCAAIAGLSH